MKKRLLWLLVYIICLLILYIANFKFDMYSWNILTFIALGIGIISYISLELKISKNKEEN